MIASFFLGPLPGGGLLDKTILFSFSNVAFSHFLPLASGCFNRHSFVFVAKLAGSFSLSSRPLPTTSKLFVWSYKLRRFFKSSKGFKLRCAERELVYKALLEQQGLFQKISRLDSLYRRFRLGCWH